MRRQLFYLARASLFRYRFLGWVISSVRTMPIKRGEADFSAMRRVVRKLREGNGVCLFPEGTRTSDGQIAGLKSGFGLLSRRGEAPIVPVVIDGAFESWPRHKKIFAPGGHVAVCYGKAITVDQVKAMNDKKLAEFLTDTLRRMQNEYRVKHGKKPYDY